MKNSISNVQKQIKVGTYAEYCTPQREICFSSVGCPIAKHAKECGCGELLPYLCKTDRYLAKAMHVRLIRMQTEILGGDCCDYWYVGDKSLVFEKYRDLK